MSTISKLDPRVRRNRSDRKQKAREMRALSVYGPAKLAGYLTAEFMDEVKRDSAKTGATKDSLFTKVSDEYNLNESSLANDNEL